jgi:hypothetical protein
MMQPDGHATEWGTHTGVGPASGAKRWYQQLQHWWTARKAMRRDAGLPSLDAYWDARREAVKPLRAEAAIDIAGTQCALSMATQPYSLIQ